MAAGITMKVSYLIELMLSGIGQRGADDLKYHWFETIYGVIREQPWPWNYKRTGTVTFAPIASTETYTWVAGAKLIQASGAMSITYVNCGRYIEIDKREYKVLFIETGLNQIIVDKPIPAAQGTGIKLTFYRADHASKTTSIYDVQLDSYKVASTSPEYWKKFGGTRNQGLIGSRPRAYELRESQSIEPPLYPPLAYGAAGAGNIGAGTYEYFFTRYDRELDLDSAPGPVLKHTHIASRKQDFRYDAPGGNVASNFSYELRLWRSKVGPTGTRYAAWRVGARDPGAAGGSIEDNLSDQSLIGAERYYAGSYCIFHWHQWPDTVYSVDVRAIDGWHARPDPNDVLSIGRNNIVTELLPMGASTYIELANRGVQEQQMAIVKFRQQMAYLVRRTDKANADDPGPEDLSYFDGVPDEDSGWDPTSSYRFNG